MAVVLHAPLSRRALLRTGGALAVSFALTPPGGAANESAATTHLRDRTVAPDQVDGFLVIDAQGQVTLYSGKVEMGTGALTALTQIAAEELSVPFDRVTTVQGDTLLTPDQGPTYASLTVQQGGVQIRRAAATAREALLDRAARRLGVAKSALRAQGGRIEPVAGGKGFSYAELVAEQGLSLKLDPAAPLKDPSDYTLVGKPTPRRDIPAKVLGHFRFVQDVSLPGMLHARAVHPTAAGARLVSWNDAPCKAIAGYLRAVRQGDFLAVVATDEWAAIRASTTIVAQWSAGTGLPDQAQLVAYMRNAKVDRAQVLQQTGDATQGMAGEGRQLQASYDFPLHTHGSIGPSCALADYQNGQLTVWTPSQASHLLRKQLAAMLKLAPEKVRCIYFEGAGCYGRNGSDDCASEAALVAVALGRPVRLQWMRADEHGWDPKCPPTLLDYRARINGQGRVAAWEAEIYLPERPMKRSGVTLLGAELADLPRYGPDGGVYDPGLGIPYAFESSKLTANWLLDTPLPAAWIRAPGRMQNTFGNESFLDEIAAVTGDDPFEFRTRHLNDSRGLELMARLRTFANWQPRGTRARDAGEVAIGRGVSYAKYELARTYVGVVADVEVRRSTGAIKVRRVFVVHDCGQIINPDGLRNQIEGNVVQTVSRTLVEQLAFNRSAVTSLNWGSYPILTFPDVPEVAIDLIDRPREVPWGAGEPTTSVIPSAIANAVFDATGARLRSLPLRPPQVLAALARVGAR